MDRSRYPFNKQAPQATGVSGDSGSLDKSRIPFGGASPAKVIIVPGGLQAAATAAVAAQAASSSFSKSRFPVAGAGEPLQGLALTLEESRAARAWDASSAWFNDVLTQTWGQDLERVEVRTWPAPDGRRREGRRRGRVEQARQKLTSSFLT